MVGLQLILSPLKEKRQDSFFSRRKVCSKAHYKFLPQCSLRKKPSYLTTVLFIVSWSPGHLGTKNCILHIEPNCAGIFEMERFEAERRSWPSFYSEIHFTTTTTTQAYVAYTVERLLLFSLALLWSDEFKRTSFSTMHFLERKHSIYSSVHPSIFSPLRRPCINSLLRWYELFEGMGDLCGKMRQQLYAFSKHTLKIWLE